MANDIGSAVEDTLSSLAGRNACPNVLGLGTDVVNLRRFYGVWGDRGESLRRIAFTQPELSYVSGKQQPERHLAGIFAAKEAVFKALSLSWREGSFAWTMIEIQRSDAGAPVVALRGLAAEGLERLGATRVLVSLAYEEEVVVAVAQAIVDSLH